MLCNEIYENKNNFSFREKELHLVNLPLMQKNSTRKIFVDESNLGNIAHIQQCTSNWDLMHLPNEITFYALEPQINDYKKLAKSDHPIVTSREYLYLHGYSKIINHMYRKYFQTFVAKKYNRMYTSLIMNGEQGINTIVCKNPSCCKQLSDVNKGTLGTRFWAGAIHHIKVIKGSSFHKADIEPSRLMSQIKAFENNDTILEIMGCVTLCDDCHSLIHKDSNLSINSHPTIIPWMLENEENFNKTITKLSTLNLQIKYGFFQEHFKEKTGLEFNFENFKSTLE